VLLMDETAFSMTTLTLFLWSLTIVACLCIALYYIIQLWSTSKNNDLCLLLNLTLFQALKTYSFFFIVKNNCK
jgi:hypothetical protein